MKIFWGIVIALVVVIGVLGLMAPTDLHIEREITIAKPRSVVFDYLKNMKNSGEWNPWDKRDPQITKTFTGTDGAVGSIMAWSGNEQVGAGEQEIKNIVPENRIDYELRFKKPMEDKGTAYLITEPVGDTQTKVKWGMDGKNKFPANIICLLLNLQAKLTADFDEGLSSMKAKLEAR